MDTEENCLVIEKENGGCERGILKESREGGKWQVIPCVYDVQ